MVARIDIKENSRSGSQESKSAPSNFLIWCEIICYFCNSTVAGRFIYSKIHRSRMMKDALDQGWSRAGSMSQYWHCPSCVKTRADNG